MCRRGDPPYTFVTEGIERAVEQARTAAGEKNVALMGATIVQQCLRAGLLDELTINLVPIVLGRGVRVLDGLEPGSCRVRPRSGRRRPRRHAADVPNDGANSWRGIMRSSAGS